MTKMIRESLGESPARTGPGRVLLTLISPGEGSSGTYTKEVLAQAAKDKVWPRGTQSHINHDTALERMDRPEGNLRNMVGVLVEDAYVSDGGALVAEALIGSAWRDFVEEFKDFIGVSIVAAAEVKDTKSGRIIEKLLPAPFNRADLVTIAGRGGKVTEILESAKRISESLSIVGEATANDTREWLAAAVKAEHGSDETYVWVRDFDEANVWFEVSGPEETTLYQQAYTLSGNTAALEGEPTPVRIETSYVPITPAVESISSPADPAGVTTNQEEATMATIDDAELKQLREAASRATALEAENETLKTENGGLKESGIRSQAEAIVAEAFGDIDAKATRKALVTAAVAAEAFNAEALAADAKEAAAEYAVAHGAGRVHGVGTPAPTVTESVDVADADVLTALKGA